ncbi:MAG: geranylgeranyl reductase family protein [Bacteroidales bacterium]|nr:geranylgeranyl reductase family protein [Bacteroidales bacterium]
MMTDADVIIAGAGPAGTLAAYELATNGISVLILEKSQFPRYKVCGAGLTHKILGEIPFDISPVIETRIHNITFSKGLSERFTRYSTEAIMYCTNRDKLDDFLLKKAIEAGARVIHGAKVTEVAQSMEFVTVKTRDGSFCSKLVIGADGASSSVARSSGLRENILPGLAWEAEIRADPATVKAFAQTVFLDWGTFPGGYGWVFPKGGHFSVGVGGPASLSKWMMPYYEKLLGYLAADHGIHALETISLKSWPIPVRIKRSRFHNGRILVAGDAAGLTDPLTGEGIYYALKSGVIAARRCHEYLHAATPSLESYTKAVNDELMSELLEANRIKHLFNTVPRRIHHFVRDSDRAWRAFVKILRGERWYADVPAGFGKWKVMWGVACYLSKWISDYSSNRFSKTGFKKY